MYLISIFLLYFYIFQNFVNSDLFTSSVDLQQLTYAEKDIPKLITNYIQLETERLEHLKRFILI